MSFPATERAAMTALHGVGTTVVDRLEQIGFSRLSQLRGASAEGICAQVAAMLGGTCWSNSPQARNAIAAIIELSNSPANPPAN